MPLDNFVDLPSCEKSNRHLKSLRHLTSIGAQSKSEEYVATERAMEKVRSQASFFGVRFPGRCLRPDGGTGMIWSEDCFFRHEFLRSFGEILQICKTVL